MIPRPVPEHSVHDVDVDVREFEGESTVSFEALYHQHIDFHGWDSLFDTYGVERVDEVFWGEQ